VLKYQRMEGCNLYQDRMLDRASLVVLPDTTAKRLRGPRSAKSRRISFEKGLPQKLSTTSRKVMFRNSVDRKCQLCSSRAHSVGVLAWKAASGNAMCMLISFMTILGGRLLKITNAWSRRYIQRKILSVDVSYRSTFIRSLSTV
jgi:hypothetical protein